MIVAGDSLARLYRALNHWGRVTHRCVSEVGHHWIRLSPARCQAIIWTNAGSLLIDLSNKSQSDLNPNWNILIQGNGFENVVRKMLTYESKNKRQPNFFKYTQFNTLKSRQIGRIFKCILLKGIIMLVQKSPASDGFAYKTLMREVFLYHDIMLFYLLLCEDRFPSQVWSFVIFFLVSLNSLRPSDAYMH